MKTVDVEVNDIVIIDYVEILVRGQITVEFFGFFNWRICSVGIDIFEDEFQHSNQSMSPIILWKKVVPALADKLEERIQTAIVEK
jgi:hypothetical protein